MRWMWAYASLLIAAILWPLIFPGELALRDMLVLDHPALSPSAVGWGELAARNVPQDGLLALVGQVVPASWFVRAYLLASAVGGAVGALSLALYVRAGVFGQAAALTVVLWNPFVIERLLQGQWSLVAASWWLVLIAAAGLRRQGIWQLLGLWAASLTPTGALFAVATALATPAYSRVRLLAYSLLLSFPWLLPSLLNPATSEVSLASLEAFTPRAESLVGTLGALVGLGGIWNAQAVPASREMGFALCGVALFALLLLGFSRVPRQARGLIILAGLALVGACALWLLLRLHAELAATLFSLPGAGLLRDSSKLVIMALPAYALGAAALDQARQPLLAACALALALLQVPDAPVAVQVLRPVELSIPPLPEQGALLVIDEPPLTLSPTAQPILNPLSKAYDTVESGMLVVDGVVVDKPSPAWVEATELWRAGNTEELVSRGIGVVKEKEEITVLGAPARPRPLYPLMVWLLGPALCIALAGLRNGRRSAAN